MEIHLIALRVLLILMDCVNPVGMFLVDVSQNKMISVCLSGEEKTACIMDCGFDLVP